MYKYFPHTEEDLQAMLQKVGAATLADLYADVPEQIRFRGDYQLPSEMSELEVRQLFGQLGRQNRQLTCFAGAGVYDHYTPAVIPQLLQRSELLTCYTPYQAEISQGTLHYIFEFQSMMAELTGMDVSNASMYDGTTATAEAVMMAVAAGKKQRKVLVSPTLDPKTLAVVRTYAHFHGIELEMIPLDETTRCTTDFSYLQRQLEQHPKEYAAVLVQQPNFYGIIEDYAGFAEAAHAAGALFIVNAAAANLAVLKTPGEWGADIACGDGQSLGIPMQWGGPYVGYLCCTEKLIRKMPGRIVGKTQDNRGQRAFVLTLQAREQHIRRQKATSNICSNQSLMALWATVYMALMGKEGLKEAAEQSYAGAHYLLDQLLATGHFRLCFEHLPFFNEFCIWADEDIDAIQKRCLEAGFMAGVKLENNMLMLAVTEQRTKEEIDELVKLMTH